VLVAEERSRICGFVVALTSISEWELENIAVHPDSRRRGIGRALMLDLIEAAIMTGATEIRQEIRASNRAAQGLGQSCGFVQEGRRSGYYKQPMEDSVLFKLVLSQA
jgi:[ribosomal protein S18]-alanine N-acetyltransferase